MYIDPIDGGDLCTYKGPLKNYQEQHVCKAMNKIILVAAAMIAVLTMQAEAQELPFDKSDPKKCVCVRGNCK